MKKLLCAVLYSGMACADPAMTSEECMAEAVYFEAGNQPYIGKVAVAEVVMNRVASSKYPNSVCSVVHQGKISKWWLEHHDRRVPLLHKCQFSYYCDGKEEEPAKGKNWEDSKEVALLVVNDELSYNVTNYATHYHADYVSPYWNKFMTKTITIQNHIFYRQL